MSGARLLPFAAMLLLSISCDHAAKIAAVSVLETRPLIEMAGGVVRFELAYNPGAFLSLGAGLPVALRTALFGWVVPLLVVVASIYFLRDRSLGVLALAALGLLAGGGLANGIDRMLNDGYVTDFVSLGVGGLRTGIFNVADVAVIAGVVGMLWAGAGPARDEIAPDPP
jgi:signal peptidase II